MAEMRATNWVDPAEDPRERDAIPMVDERSTLQEFLRFQRLTLQLKCDGLTPEQLAERAVPPSTLSLLGLLRHMAEVERIWFRRRLAGQDAPQLYKSEGQPDGDFDGAVADDALVADALARWREEVAFAERFVAEAPDLETPRATTRDGSELTLRAVLVHMVEEYARHNGHADLLRERLDGRLGH